MKSVPQTPGRLPKGFDLDALLTVSQFAVWRNEDERMTRKKLPVLKGVIREGRKMVRIHPRTFLELSVRGAR